MQGQRITLHIRQQRLKIPLYPSVLRQFKINATNPSLIQQKISPVHVTANFSCSIIIHRTIKHRNPIGQRFRLQPQLPSSVGCISKKSDTVTPGKYTIGSAFSRSDCTCATRTPFCRSRTSFSYSRRASPGVRQCFSTRPSLKKTGLRLEASRCIGSSCCPVLSNQQSYRQIVSTADVSPFCRLIPEPVFARWPDNAAAHPSFS